MYIDVEKLQQITNKIFQELRDRGVEQIQVTEDYYWEIPTEQCFEYHETHNVVAGQLYDDWPSILKVLDDDHFFEFWHELQHLIGILRYIEYVDLQRRFPERVEP